MNKTLGIVSLGCAKNQVDSEVMLGLLKDKGYKIVNRSIDAEVIIVNTCGFIETAKEESLNAILEQAKFKKHGKCKTLVVAGCLAERYNKELLEQIPEIDAIVGSGDYMKIASVLDEVNEGERVCKYGSINQTFTGHLPRVVSSSKPTAYLKIAEGCDNRCTYCIIPSLRGEYRSKPLNYVLDEAKNLARQGFKELILVAQDITRYGQDSNGQYDLNLLLRELCKIEGVKWIRLLYAYPDRITKELINTIATEDKICKYLDIPIQHISQKILTSMNRTSNSSDIVRLVKYIREKIPAIVLRTSLIVGFPGESEEDFKELEDFLEEGYFDHVGIFTYSKEEGTTAALMDMQIAHEIKLERQQKLYAIQKRISKRLNRKRMGQSCDILIEGLDSDGVYYGRSYGETLESDGLVYVLSNIDLQVGSFYKVRINKAYEYDLLGEVEDNELS